MTDPPAVTADLHAHLGDVPSEQGLRELLVRAEKAGIRRIFSTSSRPEEIFFPPSFTEKVSGGITVFRGFGIHPWFADRLSGFPDWNDRLLALLAEPDSGGIPGFQAAVGEIGLDFGKRGLAAAAKEAQRELFRYQLEIADRFRYPVVIHSCGAAAEALETAFFYRNVPIFLFHGFVGTVSRRKIDDRFFFSFSEREIGPNRRRGYETAKRLAEFAPILAESDCPAGGNEPAGVPETARRLAEIGADPATAEQIFFNRWEQIRIWRKY